MGGADQKVGCRSDVGYYHGGGSVREREREIIFFNIVYEQYLTSSSMVLFIDNLLRRLMRD